MFGTHAVGVGVADVLVIVLVVEVVLVGIAVLHNVMVSLHTALRLGKHAANAIWAHRCACAVIPLAWPGRIVRKDATAIFSVGIVRLQV